MFRWISSLNDVDVVDSYCDDEVDVAIDSFGVDDVADCVCDVVVDRYADVDVDEVDCGGGR